MPALYYLKMLRLCKCVVVVTVYFLKKYKINMEVLTLLFVEFRKCMMLFDEFRNVKLHLIVNNRCAYFASASQVNVLVSLPGLTHGGVWLTNFLLNTA